MQVRAGRESDEEYMRRREVKVMKILRFVIGKVKRIIIPPGTKVREMLIFSPLFRLIAILQKDS